MPTFLSFSNSSDKHVLFGEDVGLRIDAHLHINHQLTAEQKAELEKERKRLQPYIDTVFEAAACRAEHFGLTYRQLKAQQDVADYLCDYELRQLDALSRPFRDQLGQFIKGGAGQLMQGLVLSRALRLSAARTASVVQGAAVLLRQVPTKIPFAAPMAGRLERAGTSLFQVNDKLAALEAERSTLANREYQAKVELREAMQQMNGRLRSHFPQAFIESLYPQPVKAKRTKAAAAPAEPAESAQTAA